MTQELITAERIARTIEHSLVYGEYDETHDRSPSFELPDRIVFLESMLDNRNQTEPYGQVLIIQYIHMLITEAKQNPNIVIDKLMPYQNITEVIKIIKTKHSG